PASVRNPPNTDGCGRVAKSPTNVLAAFSVLTEMHGKLKEELGADGYMDYNLVICQANGRPIMTEHLNKRFKDILAEMDDPEIDPAEIVFHSLRHTSASAKLTLSNGDYNSVKQAGGWANLEMLTRRYGTHSFASDREKLNQKMDDFLEGKDGEESGPADTEQALKVLAQADPALLMEIVKSIQSANKS
ncbi:MAG: site-specific integrase, partial [Clostridiaceae bacterium]|nr:site-specific integrase [Clostridiaceae bacterium]